MRMTIHIENLEAIAGMMDVEKNNIYPNYSGRGMYGDECVGIATGDGVGGGIAFLLAAIELASSSFEEDEFMPMIADLAQGRVESLLWEWARETRTDNMGYETLIYWPNLQVTGLEDDNSEDDDL